MLWRTGEVYMVFWWEDLSKRHNLEDIGVDGRIILKRIFKKQDVDTWTGLIWLRIGTCGGHLCM
jgi:uncharacterized protein (UPF0128 family)